MVVPTMEVKRQTTNFQLPMWCIDEEDTLGQDALMNTIGQSYSFTFSTDITVIDAAVHPAVYIISLVNIDTVKMDLVCWFTSFTVAQETTGHHNVPSHCAAITSTTQTSPK